MYYVYRHIRDDLNIPFYIGMGTSVNNGHKRAFSKKHRNKIWNRITNKTSYSVDIIWESESKEEVFEKEKEFINLYGRIDLKKGTLCNLTNGGDGSTLLSKSVISGIVKKNRENGCFVRRGEFIVKWNKENGNSFKNKKRDKDYFKNVKNYLYDNVSGDFIKSFYNINELCLYLNSRNSIICDCIKKNKPYKNYAIFKEFKGDKIIPLKKGKDNKIVYKIDLNGNVVNKYDSILNSAKENNLCESIIHNAIKLKRTKDNFIYSHFNEINIDDYKIGRIVNKKGIRKTTCSKCNNIKEKIERTYCSKCINFICRERYKKNKK
jgi:hypothetical protein